VMARRFLRNRLIWLSLLFQLVSTTSSAAGVVLCVGESGSVAIETRLAQIACCGDFAAARDGSHSGPVLIEDDPCADTPLDLPGALSQSGSRAPERVACSAVLVTAATSLACAPYAHLQLPPQRVLPPDRTREALSTVVLLV
jgi:hypothetical protein